MELKKIAVICNYRLMPTRVGGMDYFYWLFDSECKAKGYEITWFFPNKETHGGYENLTIISVENEPLETFFVRYIKENEQKFDVVITHFVELCTPFFKQVKKVYPSKTIAIDHNPRPFGGYPLKKKITKKIKGLLYSGYTDIFVGVSNRTKNEIGKDFGKSLLQKTVVIHNGIDTSKYIKKTNYNTHNCFLVACHLRKEKGIQDLIEAIKLLPNDFLSKFSVDIFGEGYYKEKLQKLALNLSNVRFKGSVSNLYETYQNYDYLIHPSLGETFCYTVVEALECKLPVITTTNEGNVLGIVKENENGFLFSESNIEQLSEILFSIIKGDKRITKLNIEQNTVSFSIEKMVNEHLTLIEKIA